MSKKTKELLFVGLGALVILALVLGVGGQVSIPYQAGRAVEKYSKTYATKQVDTIVFVRDPAASGYAFAVHFKDSAATLVAGAATVRRIIDGTLMPAIAGDTLNFSARTFTTDGSTSSTTFSNGSSLTGTITLAPLCDQYMVILKYDTLTATQQGVTTPTAVYEVLKVFSK